MYIVFSIIFSFIGYFIFLVSYPVETGDTNKASYIIQMFHMLGLLSAIYLEKKQKEKFVILFNGCEYFYCSFFS